MAKKTTAAPRGAAPKSPFRKQAGGLGSINPIPTPAELLSKTAPEPPMTGVNPLSKGLASGHYFAGHGPGVDEPIGKGFAPQSLAANPVHPVGGFMARNFPETAAKPLPAFLAHHADKQLNWARYLPEALGGAAATPIGLVTGNKNLFQSGSRSLWSPVVVRTYATKWLVVRLLVQNPIVNLLVKNGSLKANFGKTRLVTTVHL
jgi:hypothetical protein